MRSSPVEGDRLQFLTAFGDANAMAVRYVGIPDGPFGIEADAVGDVLAEVGPDPTVEQSAIPIDVESRESAAVGLGHDQGRVVSRDGHSVREPQTISDLSGRSIGC